jgi:hypothetical protein
MADKQNKYIENLRKRKDSFSTLRVKIPSFRETEDFHVRLSLLALRVLCVPQEADVDNMRQEFKINCKTASLEWDVYRRYNNFVVLHRQLCTKFPWLKGFAPRVQLPVRKWVGNRKYEPPSLLCFAVSRFSVFSFSLHVVRVR